MIRMESPGQLDITSFHFCLFFCCICFRCIASWHCVAYAMYIYGDVYCYIYDTQATSGPDGSDSSSTLFAGSTNAVSDFAASSHKTTYAFDPGNYCNFF